jgi:DNA-binding beta-propeller fold protein YncE
LPLFWFLVGTSSFTTSAQTVLVVQEGLGNVVMFSAAEPSRRTAIPVGEKPHEIELTPDGRVAYISNFGLLEANFNLGTPGVTISVIDVEHRTERTRFKLPEGRTAPHGLKLRPPEYSELFTNAERDAGGMVVFDAESGAVIRAFSLPPTVHNFLFNPEGSGLFAFSMNGEIFRIDPDSGKVMARVEVRSTRGLGWTADARNLIASGKNEILILDPGRLSIEREIRGLGAGQIFYPAATPDGRWILAPAVFDGVILVIDAEKGAVVHRVHTGSPLLLAITPDGKKAWVSNVLIPPDLLSLGAKARPGGVALLDLSTFDPTPIPDISDANGIAISPIL